MFGACCTPVHCLDLSHSHGQVGRLSPPLIGGFVSLNRKSVLIDLPVLVTTGTATSAFDWRSFGPVDVMHKPFDAYSVAAVARKLLEPK